jgi:hypothetical protein
MAQGSGEGISRRVAAIAVAALSVWALAGCDRISADDRIGVTSGMDGSVQILYLGCADTRLAAVALYDGNDPTVGGDEELLWEIRSEDGGDGGVFTVGSQPEGFVETVPFQGAFTDRMVAAVEIEDAVGTSISFFLTDLEPGMVFSNGNPSSNMGADAFEQRARESCQGQ